MTQVSIPRGHLQARHEQRGGNSVAREIGNSQTEAAPDRHEKVVVVAAYPERRTAVTGIFQGGDVGQPGTDTSWSPSRTALQSERLRKCLARGLF